jgi:hypothetical protein
MSTIRAQYMLRLGRALRAHLRRDRSPGYTPTQEDVYVPSGDARVEAAAAGFAAAHQAAMGDASIATLAHAMQVAAAAAVMEVFDRHGRDGQPAFYLVKLMAKNSVKAVAEHMDTCTCHA